MERPVAVDLISADATIQICQCQQCGSELSGSQGFVFFTRCGCLFHTQCSGVSTISTTTSSATTSLVFICHLHPNDPPQRIVHHTNSCCRHCLFARMTHIASCRDDVVLGVCETCLEEWHRVGRTTGVPSSQIIRTRGEGDSSSRLRSSFVGIGSIMRGCHFCGLPRCLVQSYRVAQQHLPGGKEQGRDPNYKIRIEYLVDWKELQGQGVRRYHEGTTLSIRRPAGGSSLHAYQGT